MTDLFARPGLVPSHVSIHECRVCGLNGIYGLGEAWFCRQHVPAGFLPHLWGPRDGAPSVCVRCGLERGQPGTDQLCPGDAFSGALRP